MVRIGQMNRLQAVKRIDAGLLLAGGEFGNILLPRRYVTEAMAIGDELEVFVYLAAADCITATTRRPRGMLGVCALLTVSPVAAARACLDAGLPKDLPVPHNGQHTRMEIGRSHAVTVYRGSYPSRVTASS